MRAGIYFHIPFCKQACHYCDFHFVTSQKNRPALLTAMKKELQLQKANGFLPAGMPIGSLYFGGGTPSLLSGEEIQRLIDQADQFFDLTEVEEITLEANPDDLSAEKLQAFRHAGINRFSIGVQSFFDEDLQWMNRAHRADEAVAAIQRAQDAGFSNLTIDLIYGYPLLTHSKWEANIQRVIDLHIPHISAYSMTVEPRTALGTFVRRGEQPPMDDEQSAQQFEYLMDRLAGEGYGHYEISNWAKPGWEAIHNSSYWKGHPYLGIGPSAHSYNGFDRQWNISNNPQYIRAILDTDTIPAERETLSNHDRINEYIMTSLRTSAGLDLAWMQGHFSEAVAAELAPGLATFIQQGLLTRSADRFMLTRSGKLMADRVAAELFISAPDGH